MPSFLSDLKKRITRRSPSPSRPQSPNPSTRGPSRSPTPSPSTRTGHKINPSTSASPSSPTPSTFTLGHKAESAALFIPIPAAVSKSTLATTSRTEDGDDDDDTPAIFIEETPASPTSTVVSADPSKHRQYGSSFRTQMIASAIQSQDSIPAKRRFAQSGNSQQDIAALHVAYVVRDSVELQDLILEIVRISGEPDFKDVVKPAVAFASNLVAALDLQPAPEGLKEAISKFLAAIQSIDLDNSPDKALITVQQAVREIKRDQTGIAAVYHKHSSRFSTIASTVLGVALPLFDILESAASMIPVPMVEPLIGVVAGFLKAADEASNNFEWMRWLAATAAEYIVRIAVICPRDLDDRWTKAIETLDQKLSEIVKDAAEFSKGSVISRFLRHGGDKGDIEVMKENLKAAINVFNAEVQFNIKLDLDNMSRNIESLLLDNLPRLPSHKISHDRYFRASREQEIQETLEWVEANDGERFLWMHGAAGVGKSTYARRLLDHIKEEGMLGAFAYFAIGIDSDPKDLVRMMARELASLHPGCRHDVVRAIKECAGVHQGLDEYIMHFLVRPISTLSYSGPLVIILDALDEWAYREEFLSALVTKVRLPETTALKFIMTSRYSTGIDNIVSGNARTRELTPVSETICREYFEDRFKTVAWYGHEPGSAEFDQLVELADGLLIWAATVCTLVSVKRPNKRPHQILDDILTSSSSVARGKRMEELYGLAMKRIFPDEDDEIKESRSNILLAMAALKEAIPLPEFALLVDVLPEFVNDICIGLRALQTRGAFDESLVQPAIKIFHASFIDYFGTLQEARSVMARHCISFFERWPEADEPVDRLSHLFRHAQLYMGKHFPDHLQEAPTDLQSTALSQLTVNDLRMWSAWSLAHVMAIGEDNGCAPGSRAMDTMSQYLCDDEGIIYSPELMSRTDDQILSMVSSGQKMLELAGIDWDDASTGINGPVKYETEAQRWVHVINSVAMGFLLSQQVDSFNADRPRIRGLESTIGHLDGIANAFETDCPSSISVNLAFALELRFMYSGVVEDLERAITLYTSVQQRISESSPAYITFLTTFASALHIRFQYVGSNKEDLDRSISLHREAMARDPSNHHKRPTLLDNLGFALHTRYLLRSPEDPTASIHEVVELHEEAMQLHSKHSSHLPRLLNHLSSALQSKYEQQQDREVLQLAFFYALQAASTDSLGNLEQSAYTATLAHSVHLASQARIDPCANVPQEFLFLCEKEKFIEIISFDHPSRRHIEHTAVARDLYREASNALPITAPGRLPILNQLGLAQQARATMGEELDLRYADEAIFLHHLTKRRQHEAHPMRTLSEQYLQRAYQTLREYNIPLPDPDVPLQEVTKTEEEIADDRSDISSDNAIPLYTSDGERCDGTSTGRLYNTRFLHHLRNYVKDSGEPVILYRFSSTAYNEIWRLCGDRDVDSDSESIIEGIHAKDDDFLDDIPTLWNLMCSAKYLAIWGLPEKILSEGPTRLSGSTYHDLVTCFAKRTPWEFEHQFLYLKAADAQGTEQGEGPIHGLDIQPHQTGCDFVTNPLEFAVIFYLASIFEDVPSLRNLAGVISTHKNGASEATGELAKALLEVIPLIQSRRDDVSAILDTCSRTMDHLLENEPDPTLTSMKTIITNETDNLKSSFYSREASSPNKPCFSDLLVHISQFLNYSKEDPAYSDIFIRALKMGRNTLVQPLLDILLRVCDRYFKSNNRHEEEIHFIMIITLAQLFTGIAFVSSDSRYPVDGRFYHATRSLSESIEQLLGRSQKVEDLAAAFRDIVLKFRREAYDRSQLARTFVICMACHSIRLWDRGWANRWYYVKMHEKIESAMNTESDLESNDEDEMPPGRKMRRKLGRNLRLGARRKLMSAVPIQLKEKKPVKKDEEKGEEDTQPPEDEQSGDKKSEDEPESIAMPVPEPYDHESSPL